MGAGTSARIDALTLFDAGLAVSRAEHRLRSRLVQQLLEGEPDAAVRARAAAERLSSRVRAARCGRCICVPGPRDAADGPAGQDLRELLHVLLRVAAVDAERVQLEQLARVVLVQARAAGRCPRPPTRAPRERRADRLKVVEIDEHRRMLRRREHHVFEPPEHVRPDHFALVAAGERRDENLGADGDAEMIRPERDEPLDERPIGGDALGQRGTALGGRNADERAARLLAGLPPLPVVGLSNRAKRANGIGNCVRRAFGRRAQDRRAALQLPAQPAARIADPLALAGACAEPEPIEGAKRGIHKSTSIH